MEGDPKFPASQDLPDMPYAAFAEMIGLEGVLVDTPDAAGPGWDRALAADKPCVLEAITDPDVPPLPPHITLEQAKAFTFAVARGDPDAGGILRQSLRDRLAGVLHNR